MIEAIVIVLAIILDPFVGVSLMVTATVVLAWHSRYQVFVPVTFGLGIIYDLWAVRWLGGSSIVLLTMALLIYIIREQFDLRQAWLVGLCGFLGEAGWRIIVNEPVRLNILLWQMLLCTVVWTVLRYVRPKSGVYLKG